jgi:hypothetical protein
MPLSISLIWSMRACVSFIAAIPRLSRPLFAPSGPRGGSCGSPQLPAALAENPHGAPMSRFPVGQDGAAVSPLEEFSRVLVAVLPALRVSWLAKRCAHGLQSGSDTGRNLGARLGDLGAECGVTGQQREQPARRGSVSFCCPRSPPRGYWKLADAPGATAAAVTATGHTPQRRPQGRHAGPHPDLRHAARPAAPRLPLSGSR